MADTAYTILRAYKDGGQLTPAQKTSSLFAEEPVVLGKILRRGSKPMRISAEQYKLNEPKLLALEKAGAIRIKRPESAPAVPEKNIEELNKEIVEQHTKDRTAEVQAAAEELNRAFEAHTHRTVDGPTAPPPVPAPVEPVVAAPPPPPEPEKVEEKVVKSAPAPVQQKKGARR